MELEQELAQQWCDTIGGVTPDNKQWQRWITGFGEEAIRYALRVTANKFRKMPDMNSHSLQKFCNSVGRSKSAELGIWRPKEDRYDRYVPAEWLSNA